MGKFLDGHATHPGTSWFYPIPAGAVLYLTGDTAMGKLTSRRRKRLKKKSFALPGSKKYPIHDRSHAANALSRVAQHGSSSQKKRVKMAV